MFNELTWMFIVYLIYSPPLYFTTDTSLSSFTPSNHLYQTTLTNPSGLQSSLPSTYLCAPTEPCPAQVRRCLGRSDSPAMLEWNLTHSEHPVGVCWVGICLGHVCMTLHNQAEVRPCFPGRVTSADFQA